MKDALDAISETVSPRDVVFSWYTHSDLEHVEIVAWRKARSETPAPSTGRKDDTNKRRMDLLPPRAIEAVADVLTFGAAKYGPDNWRMVEGRRWRYHAAALRHIFAWARGERCDPETGLHHLAHAVCCLLFILDEEVSGDA